MTRNDAIFAAGLVDAAIGTGDRLLDEVDYLTRRHQDGPLPEQVVERVDELLGPHLRRMSEQEGRADEVA